MQNRRLASSDVTQSTKLLGSREIGDVPSSTKMDGFGVNQALVTNCDPLAGSAVIEWKTRAAEWNIQS